MFSKTSYGMYIASVRRRRLSRSSSFSNLSQDSFHSSLFDLYSSSIPLLPNVISPNIQVNGLHTVLAFMTLASKVPSSDQVGLASDKLVAPWADLVLITPKDATPQQQRTVWCWAVARLLVLLFECVKIN